MLLEHDVAQNRFLKYSQYSVYRAAIQNRSKAYSCDSEKARKTPAAATSKRLRDWRNSSRRRGMKTSGWRQRDSRPARQTTRWQNLRRGVLRRNQPKLDAVADPDGPQCQVLPRLDHTLRPCVRSLMPNGRNCPSPDLQFVETHGEETESESCGGPEGY